MKYIKKFENIEEEKLIYKTLDYVYIDTDNYTKPILPYAVIIFKNSLALGRTWDYLIECYDTSKNKFVNNYIYQSHILRKMTNDEKNEYYARQEAEKYNL